LAIITAGIRTVGQDVFLVAAQALAALVTDQDLDNGTLYPPLQSIQDVSLHIATVVAEYAYRKGEILVQVCLPHLVESFMGDGSA